MSIKPINELIKTALPALEDLGCQYSTNPPKITNGINALSLIVPRIFSGELNDQEGREIAVFKEKLIDAISWSTRPIIIKPREICFVGSEISACNCSTNVNFSNRRSFSDFVLQAIQNTFTNLKEIFIGDLGSGCCYQDLMVHAVLIKAGYQVRWTLIDLDLVDPNSSAYKASEQFKKLTNFFGPCRVELKGQKLADYCNSLSHLEPINIPNILIVADLEYQGSTVDLKPIHEKLNELKNSITPRLFIQLDKRSGISYEEF